MKRSTYLGNLGIFYCVLGIAMAVCGSDPAYQAMFGIMAAVAIVGSEILKGLGR